MTLSVSLSVIAAITLSMPSVQAAKIDAPPLPIERQAKDFQNGEECQPATSRFNRRPDYREAEVQKKKDQEAAQKAAAENAAKARQAQIDAVKNREQSGISANNRGVALGQQRRWAEAISEHEKAVTHDPANRQFRINLSAARTAFGQERLAAGDLNSAASLFRKALSASSDNGLAQKLLSETMKKMGRDPGNADVRLATGDQLTAIGDFEGAAIEYQTATQIEPSARTYLKMGDMALRYNQISTAENWYRQAISKDTNYGPAHRQLGFISLSKKDFTSAASSLRKAVVLDPKDGAAGQTLVEIWRKQVASNPLLAENHLGLAGALQLTGDFNGADGEYRKLEALDAKHPGLEPGRASLQRALVHAKAEKHKAAAETFFRQGLRPEALAQIGQAVMMEPKNDRYQFLLGEILESSGDYRGAQQAYHTCVLIDPERNQEAAARLRDLQNSMRRNAQMQQQAAQPQINPYLQTNAPSSQPKFINQMQPPASVLNSTANVAMQPTESPYVRQIAGGSNVVQGNPSETTTAAPAASAHSLLNDGLSKVTDLEGQQKYAEAIQILQELITSDVRNAELHHRLAVNLLASGQTVESISEYRIASALRPDKKEYAEDLARALNIHKRALGGIPEVVK